MGSDLMQDKLSIKNLLFTKVMPNLTTPVPTEGYMTYPCTDCGDRFLLRSSYETHINRMSLTITYRCQHCHETKIFNNRCKLLSHIRSHAFKSATINVSDLKIEPLPQRHFKSLTLGCENQFKDKHVNTCYECKNVIEAQGQMHKARAEHYMKFTEDPFFTCPICLFTIPTSCGLLAHLRIHLKIPPYYCPECGFQLPNRSISYPYSHDCDGFKMMRATTRSKCPVKNCCTIVHPSQYAIHLKRHYKKIFKCQICSETLNGPKPHTTCPNANTVVWFQCPLCTDKIFLKAHFDKHLNAHLFKDQLKDAYQCHICKTIFNQMHFLLNHSIIRHGATGIKNILSKIIRADTFKNKKNSIYRVVKKCDKCLVSFTYRCQYENIKTLPNECPYRCSSKSVITTTRKKDNILPEDNKYIICFLCKKKIKEDWDIIKAHYAMYHETYKCLDLKVNLQKIDNRLTLYFKKKGNNNLKIVKKNSKRSRSRFFKNHRKINLINKNNETQDGLTENVCKICNYISENKMQLENHIITHKDPYMAYQCLECGQCFAVKRSFSTHLLMEHEISDVQGYVDNKNCFNELALQKNQRKSSDLEKKPLNENQCSICREQFENSSDLEKHFRVHGMAFLMKNKNGSP